MPLFDRLKASCAPEWSSYVDHPFVRGLADGTLPEACFRHYLIQDYLFLIQFARAYALAAYKAETLPDIRQATEGLKAIVEVEMGLHVQYCTGWGLSEAQMQAAPEADACMAYTRYVLEKGLAGDLLDLHVALAPCIVGYGEIGAGLASDPATKRDDNPYADWIGMYASTEYQDMARAEAVYLDDLFARRGGEGRWPGLQTTFRQATRLEAAFWDMGMTPS
ncbi:thiaminase II [Magnetospira sp. QH-2]|uniref:thiaminase II n=1 Tax=Magnetospira sp. (strain QH-2) TaxID=1288970 RepID=UPI0003E812F7|nr:thiaminase II [Magnetospira sp. QH-2]CCQ74487.1 Transcriptional activator, TenA family [Magnetospira sp. QH-2]